MPSTTADAPALELRTLGAPLRRPLAVIDRVLAGRWWLLWVVLASAAISLLAAFPPYENFDPTSSDWTSIVRAGDRPFDQEGLDPTDRTYNFTFRVTVPLLGGLVNLSPQGYLVLQGLAGLGLFAVSALAVERATRDRRMAAAAAVGVGLMWAGACGFVEVRGNFDVVAIGLLVAAIASRRPPVIALCTFLACWTDERAIPAVAFVMLAQHAIASRDLSIRSAIREPRVWAPAVGVVLHVVTRLLATAAFDLEQPSNLGTQYIEEQVNIWAIGSWTGLEGWWIFVGLGAAVLWRYRQRFLALVFVGWIGLFTIMNIAVVDVTRSMAYLLPAGFAGFLLAQRTCSPRFLRGTMLLAFAITAAWPLYYAGGVKTVYWLYPMPLAVFRQVFGLG